MKELFKNGMAIVLLLAFGVTIFFRDYELGLDMMMIGTVLVFVIATSVEILSRWSKKPLRSSYDEHELKLWANIAYRPDPPRIEPMKRGSRYDRRH